MSSSRHTCARGGRGSRRRRRRRGFGVAERGGHEAVCRRQPHRTLKVIRKMVFAYMNLAYLTFEALSDLTKVNLEC